jgi:hypothetical protein
MHALTDINDLIGRVIGAWFLFLVILTLLHWDDDNHPPAGWR